MSTPTDIYFVVLDAQLKSNLARLCLAHGLPHCGLKAQLLVRHLDYSDRLPSPSPAPSACPATYRPATEPGSSLPQPLFSSPLAQEPLLAAHRWCLHPRHCFHRSRRFSCRRSRHRRRCRRPHRSPYLVPQPLPATMRPEGAGTATRHSQLDVQLLAQQGAQQAATQVLLHLTRPSGGVSQEYLPATCRLPPCQASNRTTHRRPLPPCLSPYIVSFAPSTMGPTTTSTTTNPSWVYQPLAATPQQVLEIESTLVPSVQAALTAPSSLLATPPLHQLAPFSGSIPSIPTRFATAAAGVEFINFNELLHARARYGSIWMGGTPY